MPTIVQTLTIGPIFFETVTFNVPKFDTALGRLLRVDVVGHVHNAATYGVEFLCTGVSGRSSTTINNHSYTEAIFQGAVLAVGSGVDIQTLTAASNFDGINDLAGNSGRTVLAGYDYDMPAVAPVSDASGLRYFSGAGTIPVQFVLHKTAAYGNSEGECGQTLNFSFQNVNEYTYTLTVTYTY